MWGRQKRRVWEGKDWHGNIDGYAQSLLGRIREERDGASQCTPSQRWPEVYWGAGLDVQRCLMGMPERQHAVLHFQYVWNPEWGITADRKAKYIGVKRTEYFELVDRSETWIHARLEPASRSDSQLVEKVHEIVGEALRGRIDSVTKAQARAKCHSELNLSALSRSKISLR